MASGLVGNIIVARVLSPSESESSCATTYSLVISKRVHLVDETRLLISLANSFPPSGNSPSSVSLFTHSCGDSDITRHITCQPTSKLQPWGRLSVYPDSLWTNSYTYIGHFSLPFCPSGWKAGGWSLKVISDAVSMSQAGQPLANTVIRLLDSERSNQNQSV